LRNTYTTRKCDFSLPICRHIYRICTKLFWKAAGSHLSLCKIVLFWPIGRKRWKIKRIIHAPGCLQQGPANSEDWFKFNLWICRDISNLVIPRWLRWYGVSLPMHWVNAEWKSTSTESTKSETPLAESMRDDQYYEYLNEFQKTFKYNVSILWLCWCVVSFTLTQSSSSFTLRWLTGRGVSLCVDSKGRK
jgi:hypothetical protein